VTRGSLGFGIVRSVEASQGRARLADLCAILTTEFGTLFVPHHPATYAELFELCERGELALAWVPPIATAKLQASGAVSVLALPLRRGAICYRAALITQDDGPASLSQVKGATIGWVDRESCSGYVMPRLFLTASSFDVKQLFARELFLGSHVAVVEAVLARRVQIGATFCAVEAASGDRGSVAPSPVAPSPKERRAAPAPSATPGSLPLAGGFNPDGRTKLPLRMLAATGPIPNDAIVVSSQLPATLRSTLLRWFLDLRDDRVKKHCAELFGASAFRVAAPEHFTALQQMMWAARAKGEVT
jgi:ABC-type phosphate/phosphonate transport system substrate-binding protein